MLSGLPFAYTHSGLRLRVYTGRQSRNAEGWRRIHAWVHGLHGCVTGGRARAGAPGGEPSVRICIRFLHHYIYVYAFYISAFCIRPHGTALCASSVFHWGAVCAEQFPLREDRGGLVRIVYARGILLRKYWYDRIDKGVHIIHCLLSS